MAFVLVQHLDPQHESALTQLLGRAISLPVLEITNKSAGRAQSRSCDSAQHEPDDRAGRAAGSAATEGANAASFHRHLFRVAGAGPARASHRGDSFRHRDRRHAGTGGHQGRRRDHLRAGRIGPLRLDAAQRRSGGLRGFRSLSGEHCRGARPHCEASLCRRQAREPSHAGRRPRVRDGARGRRDAATLGRTRDSAHRRASGARRGRARPRRGVRGEGRGGRVQESSAAAAQSFRRGFLALQIHHDPAAHRAAHGAGKREHAGRTTPSSFAATSRSWTRSTRTC